MMSSPRMLLAGSMALVLGLAATAPADEVILVPNSTVKVPGGRVRGVIQSESPTEVHIQATVGGAQTIPIDQVAEINYDGQPLTFVQAQTKESSGALADAADLYQKAAGEAAGKPLIAQAAQFGRARVLGLIAQGDPARVAEATAQLDAFAKANPTSRFVVPALETLARLDMQRGDFDKAARALADLAKVPGAAERASVLQARLLSRRGKHQDAITALDRILAAAPEGSVRRREARLARAEALAGLKKFDEAQADVRAIIDAAPPEDVETLASAYNTLGDCLVAARKPKDALYAYLYTDIIYPKDKEQHARALAHIVQVFRELKQDARAGETLDRLKQMYPQSPWLAVANAGL